MYERIGSYVYRPINVECWIRLMGLPFIGFIRPIWFIFPIIHCTMSYLSNIRNYKYVGLLDIAFICVNFITPRKKWENPLYEVWSIVYHCEQTKCHLNLRKILFLMIYNLSIFLFHLHISHSLPYVCMAMHFCTYQIVLTVT